MKFRKKPVVIDAVPFLGTASSALLVFSEFDIPDARFIPDDSMQAGTLLIPTLEGDHIATKGDWIIKGVKGEFYPCKPDIFQMTYEPVII